MSEAAPQRAALFLIDKPPGPTSHDIVAKVRRMTEIKRVGHGGTLDPMASGLLPVFVGAATRLIEYLGEHSKSYEAIVRLGVQTDTDDAEGEAIAEQPVPELDAAMIEAALAEQRGEIQQMPPIYSAIKVGGVAAHRAARRGQPLELEPRSVTIHDLQGDLVAPDRIRLRMRCSAGTYVRSVARDLGERLGCGGHVAEMRRTAIGDVTADDAITPDALQAAFDAGTGWERSAPIDAFLTHWPHVVLTHDQRAQVAHGRSLPLLAVREAAPHVLAVNPQGWPLAVMEPDPREPGQWKPAKVLRGIG